MAVTETTPAPETHQDARTGERWVMTPGQMESLQYDFSDLADSLPEYLRGGPLRRQERIGFAKR